MIRLTVLACVICKATANLKRHGTDLILCGKCQDAADDLLVQQDKTVQAISRTANQDAMDMVLETNSPDREGSRL